MSSPSPPNMATSAAHAVVKTEVSSNDQESDTVQRRSSRRRISTTTMIDGFAVKTINNYTLEEGEPSVEVEELKYQESIVRASHDEDMDVIAKERLAEAQKSLNLERIQAIEKHRLAEKRKGNVKKEISINGREAIRIRSNDRIAHDLKEMSSRKWRFLHKHREQLLPFVSSGVAQKLRQQKANDCSDSFEVTDLAQPAEVSGTMREYQLKGLSWLMNRFDNGVNCILGDEMGLGKTLQSISLLSHLKFVRKIAGPFLVVVPLSVISSWMKEFACWSPRLRIVRLHSSDANEIMRLRTLLTDVDSYDVCLTTYEMAKSKVLSHVLQRRIRWRVMILDEGHRVKNADALISKAMRGYHSQYVVLLTGTPLQNNLVELWAVLYFLHQDVFVDSAPFRECFDITSANIIIDREMLEKAHFMLKPLMLRRTKTEVETLLPPKLETMIRVPLSEMQLFWYKRLLLKSAGLLDRAEASLQGKTCDASSEIDMNEAPNSDWKRLQSLLMQLRKASNHPFLFPGAESTPTNEAATEEIVKASGKLQVLDRLLAKLFTAGHRVVIFSQFTTMLDLLDDYLSMRGVYRYTRIDGSTNRVQRSVNIELFNQPKSPIFCFLMSTRAGGLGVNLQTADTVILYDSDWNPQVDLQAMARCHRIGQTKPVHVYRMVSAGSCEERIVQRAQKKLFLDTMVNRSGVPKDIELQRMTKGDLLKTLKFGCQAVFRGESIDSISDADLDAIIDRTRTGEATAGQSSGALVEGIAQDSAEFDENEVLPSIRELGDKDFDNEVSTLREIGETWKKQMQETTEEKRSRTSRFFEQDGHKILKLNNYDLVKGEPSVFDRELSSTSSPLNKMPKSEVKFTNQDYCLQCWEGGDVLLCDGCPASYHPYCLGLSTRQIPTGRWLCPQHECSVCSRKATQVGGLIFRCIVCPQSYCEDHRPVEGMRLIGECSRYQSLGQQHPSQACFIVCSSACETFGNQYQDEILMDDVCVERDERA